MDAFIDYLYYVNHGGSSISESEFEGFAMRASFRVNYLTFKRAEALVLENRRLELVEQIRQATLAVADVMKAFSGKQGGLESEKVGDYAVQYRNGGELRAEEAEAVQASVEMYLAHSGLMYAGVW